MSHEGAERNCEPSLPEKLRRHGNESGCRKPRKLNASTGQLVPHNYKIYLSVKPAFSVLYHHFNRSGNWLELIKTPALLMAFCRLTHISATQDCAKSDASILT